MKNWKTTVGGLLLSLGVIAASLPLPEDYKWVAQALSAVGAAILGISAKDYNTHSTASEVFINDNVHPPVKEVIK